MTSEEFEQNMNPRQTVQLSRIILHEALLPAEFGIDSTWVTPHKENSLHVLSVCMFSVNPECVAWLKHYGDD